MEKKVSFVHDTTITDPVGSFIIINISINNSSVTICNVYGLNTDDPFFLAGLQRARPMNAKVFHWVTEWPNEWWSYTIVGVSSLAVALSKWKGGKSPLFTFSGGVSGFLFGKDPSCVNMTLCSRRNRSGSGKKKTQKGLGFRGEWDHRYKTVIYLLYIYCFYIYGWDALSPEYYLLRGREKTVTVELMLHVDLLFTWETVSVQYWRLYKTYISKRDHQREDWLYNCFHRVGFRNKSCKFIRDSSGSLQRGLRQWSARCGQTQTWLPGSRSFGPRSGVMCPAHETCTKLWN